MAIDAGAAFAVVGIAVGAGVLFCLFSYAIYQCFIGPVKREVNYNGSNNIYNSRYVEGGASNRNMVMPGHDVWAQQQIQQAGLLQRSDSKKKRKSSDRSSRNTSPLPKNTLIDNHLDVAWPSRQHPISSMRMGHTPPVRADTPSDVMMMEHHRQQQNNLNGISSAEQVTNVMSTSFDPHTHRSVDDYQDDDHLIVGTDRSAESSRPMLDDTICSDDSEDNAELDATETQARDRELYDDDDADVDADTFDEGGRKSPVYQHGRPMEIIGEEDDEEQEQVQEEVKELTVIQKMKLRDEATRKEKLRLENERMERQKQADLRRSQRKFASSPSPSSKGSQKHTTNNNDDDTSKTAATITEAQDEAKRSRDAEEEAKKAKIVAAMAGL